MRNEPEPSAFAAVYAVLGKARSFGLMLLAAFGLSPATSNATTYNYVGNPLSCFEGCSGSILGLTGSVTFSFDTLGYSGTIEVYDASARSGLNAEITALTFGFVGFRADTNSFFVLNDGAITDWLVGCCNGYGIFSHGTGDFVTGPPQFGSGPPAWEASSYSPGTWTPVGSYFHGRAAYFLARPLYERALAIREKGASRMYRRVETLLRLRPVPERTGLLQPAAPRSPWPVSVQREASPPYRDARGQPKA
jgi:hypothetical protein